MIDATRSETDTEIINAYWKGYNDACKKMEKTNDNIKELITALKIVEKTLFLKWNLLNMRIFLI